jgi:serine palmitoyltransferase
VKLVGDGRTYLNLTSYDFLGLSDKEKIHQKAVDALRKYGVGACGPPGFYGTIDVHLELERALAQFLGTEEAIIYAQAYSTISGVIPAFAKRHDILVVDDGVNFAVQKGVQISRSTVRYFKHNDMVDLERVLQEIKQEDKKVHIYECV